MDITKWQLWVHYIILASVVWFVSRELFWGSFKTYWDVVILFIVIVVTDLLLHALLGALTGWDD